MRGMTEAQRNQYRKKVLAQKKVQAKRKQARQDAQNKMKRAIIQRKIRNANLLSSWKERKKAQLKRAKLAKVRAMTRNKIKRKEMQEQKALAVRNATHPGTIMAQAEKRRVMDGRRHSAKITKGKKDIFERAVQPTSMPLTSGTPEQWMKYLKSIMRSKGRDSDEFKQAVLGLPQDVIARMSPHKKKIIARLKSRFSSPMMKPAVPNTPKVAVAGLGRLTPTQCETLRAKIKTHFLNAVAKSRSVSEPSDKMNIMREFWDKWQPVLATKPQLYEWFKNDEHIRNAMMDFKGLGQWDEFTPEEAQYLDGTTSDDERSFLLGERPGEINAYTAMHPIADDMFDVEDLMPNVPSPQPDVYGLGDFTERFDVEELAPGVPTIDPVNAQLPDWSRSRRGKRPIRGNWRV